MGGGGSGGGSTGAPYDLLGGQYASFSGGTPGYNWSSLFQGIGSGMQQFGKGMATGITPVQGGGQTPNIVGEDISGVPYQPATIQQNNLIDALLRLLGGG